MNVEISMVFGWHHWLAWFELCEFTSLGVEYLLVARPDVKGMNGLFSQWHYAGAFMVHLEQGLCWGCQTIIQ